MTQIAWINVALVFLMGAAYSFVELLDFFKTARSFFKTSWGIIYIVLNGILSVVALVSTFKGEVNQSFLGIKIIISGTAALALIRVIVIPLKHNGTSNNLMPVIDIILSHVRIAYDRERSKFDLTDVKQIMKDVDYQKASEALPNLCSNLLRTITEDDGKRMNEEIQKLLTIEEGGKEIKAINLGIILAKYIGIELLRETVSGVKEYICLNPGTENDIHDNEKSDSLDFLINKFS